MGLMGAKPKVDWKQMLAYKDDVIGQNTKGIEFLFKKNKIDWLKGWGRSPRQGQGEGRRRDHEAKNIVIATGSEVAPCRAPRSTRSASSPPPARWN